MRQAAFLAGALLAGVLLAGSGCGGSGDQSAGGESSRSTATTAPGSTDDTPHFVAVLGASTAAGYAAASSADEQPANSWATGTNPKVRSIFVRLREENGGEERSENVAQPGARMSELQLQSSYLPPGVDLALVDMGTNDACEVPATTVTDFRRRLRAGLQAIAEHAPSARIVVVSTVNQLAIWDAVKTTPGARATRGVFCTPATKAGSRPGLAKTIRVLNRELMTACVHQPRCRYDGGAVFRIRWSRADVSSVDYFHPSLSGQRKIADAVWASGAITGD